MHRDFVIDFASGDMNERMGKRMKILVRDIGCGIWTEVVT